MKGLDALASGMGLLKCAACGNVGEPAEMLKVTDLETGAVRYVHRPKLVDKHVDRTPCFRASVRWAGVDAIELAEPPG